MKNYLRAAAVAAAFVLPLAVSQAAHAVIVSFTTHESGENLGTTQLATLEAMQMGNDVQFTFTNTLASHAGSKLTQLLLGYNGTASELQNIGFMPVSGVASNDFKVGIKTNPSLSKKPINNAGNDFDIDIGFPTSDAAAMNPGEFSTFKLTNALLGNFFLNSGRDPFAQLHMQALNNGESTKYSATVIPVPASLPLLLAALAGLAFIRQRRKAA